MKTQYVYDVRGSVIQTITGRTAEHFAEATETPTAHLPSFNVQPYAYTPFGEQMGAKISGYTYNAERYDAATGMVNLRARQYEPAQMRFSQPDLVRGYTSNPLTLNRYAYCLNNPITYDDPSGKLVHTSVASMVRPVTDVRTNRNTVQSVKKVVHTAVTQKQQGRSRATSYSEEKIVISGGIDYPKIKKGSKYMFIETGIKKVIELAKSREKTTQLTWVIFDVNYSDADKVNFQATASNIGAGCVIVKNRQEFINYLNTGSVDGNPVSPQTRSSTPITYMAVFSHGLRDIDDEESHLGFAYNANKQKEQTYEVKQINMYRQDIQELDPNAFESPHTDFYSCNAATKAQDGSPSFAQMWVDKTGGSARAVANGKTNYEDINSYGFWGDLGSTIGRIFGYSDEKQEAKASRAEYGYSQTGSLNYPTVSSGGKWVDIIPGGDD